MAKKREKKVIISGVTRVQMEEAFCAYALADSVMQGLKAEMEQKINAIREENQSALAKLEEQQKQAFEVLQAYATENRDEHFTKKKSMETSHGVLGFRTGTPTVKTKKGFTWEAVIGLIKSNKPEYLRTKEEVAKDKLLADRENEGMNDLFDKIGVRIDQNETFFVEPKKED